MTESAFDINLFGQWLEREHPAVMPGYRLAIAAAQASERERCAKECDEIAEQYRGDESELLKRLIAGRCAEVIRALSPTPNQETKDAR